MINTADGVIQQTRVICILNLCFFNYIYLDIEFNINLKNGFDSAHIKYNNNY